MKLKRKEHHNQKATTKKGLVQKVIRVKRSAQREDYQILLATKKPPTAIHLKAIISRWT